ncbi:uncharacterized protein LOC133631103 isoform X2 [Entelurus aequoreus]|uniref:uncharacterized protein LOC133631103 isoform X2 n=1 Tax=Entelurus aequoreus TaxID=161455 RepID=UPI002B1E0CFE|nr:uncharacterized protein LOC133631103 isoform X2 [Entelurus aequoreus]
MTSPTGSGVTSSWGSRAGCSSFPPGGGGACGNDASFPMLVEALPDVLRWERRFRDCGDAAPSSDQRELIGTSLPVGPHMRSLRSMGEWRSVSASMARRTSHVTSSKLSHFFAGELSCWRHLSRLGLWRGLLSRGAKEMERTWRAGYAKRTTFVKQGTDVLFEVNKAVELTKEHDELRWMFNISNSILRFEEGSIKTYDAYVTKIHIRGNFSFLLKNVQLSDSGHYAAVLEGGEVKAEYDVQVEAPVSSVQLMVTSMSAINDLCNISVNCTEGRESIESTFDCERDNCIEAAGPSSHNTTSAVHLQVFFSDVSIVCNNSNNSSWAMTAVEVRDVCTQSRAPYKSPYWIWILLGVIGGLGGLGCVFYKFITSRNRMDPVSTEYADLRERNHETIPNANHLNDSGLGLSAKGTYALVGFPTAPPEPPTADNTSPKSIYAQVMKVICSGVR